MNEEQAWELVQDWKETARRLIETGHYTKDDLIEEMDYVEG